MTEAIPTKIAKKCLLYIYILERFIGDPGRIQVKAISVLLSNNRCFGTKNSERSYIISSFRTNPTEDWQERGVSVRGHFSCEQLIGRRRSRAQVPVLWYYTVSNVHVQPIILSV